MTITGHTTILRFYVRDRLGDDFAVLSAWRSAPPPAHEAWRDCTDMTDEQFEAHVKHLIEQHRP